MNKKRTHIGVMRDILGAVSNKNGRIKPTHILYKSNLSYQMMDEYLKELIAKDFLIEQKLEEEELILLLQKDPNFWKSTN